MKMLSVVVPCFNEAKTISTVIERLERAALPGWEREIIIVDDGSTDGTREILRAYESKHRVLYMEKNGGKGNAVRRGLEAARGTHVLIQDADLEYDPADIAPLLGPINAGSADVVYGSRNLDPKTKHGKFIPRLGVWFITKLINFTHGLSLTDVWTCYKLFPKDTAKHFVGGGFEAELLFTAALARAGCRFAEVPISYNPRTVADGKKIRYRDGFKAIALLIADLFVHP